LKSAKISTYIYAIVAGPYDYFEKIEAGLPPMRLYARKSLKNEINHEEMFLVTSTGMRFYKDLFGKEYPFNKYDQVFVPEHNYGAMENVGCVTYNENYLFKGQTPSLAKRLRFSITNLHELAHMWFGNLVTMKWWNDLWLNESFATYMSFLAMTENKELHYFDTAWATFLQYKFWGVNADQMTSTHPVCCMITSTDEAESLFDGISYGKGSAFLKQVYNVLGFDTIRKGLHLYFETYQW
jgi:aminopeptidase N